MKKRLIKSFIIYTTFYVILSEFRRFCKTIVTIYKRGYEGAILNNNLHFWQRLIPQSYLCRPRALFYTYTSLLSVRYAVKNCVKSGLTRRFCDIFQLLPNNVEHCVAVVFKILLASSFKPECKHRFSVACTD